MMTMITDFVNRKVTGSEAMSIQFYMECRGDLSEVKVKMQNVMGKVAPFGRM